MPSDAENILGVDLTSIFGILLYNSVADCGKPLKLSV